MLFTNLLIAYGLISKRTIGIQQSDTKQAERTIAFCHSIERAASTSSAEKNTVACGLHAQALRVSHHSVV